MLKAFIRPVLQDTGANLLCGDFPVLSRQPEDLVARGLHGTGFVDIDVGRIRPNHALMGPQGGIDDRQIGLSTANQEMNVQIAVFAKGTYPLGGTAAVVIRSIAGSLLHIGFYKRLQYLRVTAFGVVIVKINHFGHLTFFSPIVLP